MNLKEKIEELVSEEEIVPELWDYGEGTRVYLRFNLKDKQYARNTITLENNVLHLSVSSSVNKSQFAMYQRISNNEQPPEDMQKSFEIMLRVWFGLIQEFDEIELVTLSGDIMFDFGDKAIETVNKLKFHRLNRVQKMVIDWLDSDFKNVQYILNLKENIFMKTIRIVSEMMEVMSDLVQKDRTAMYTWNLRTGKLYFYYKGLETDIPFQATNDCVTFSVEDKEYKIHHIDEVKDVMNQMFKDVESKNILPIKHFTSYCNSLLLSKDEEFIKRMHSKLLKVMSATDIELASVDILENKHKSSEVYVYKESTKLFIIGDYYVFVDYDTDEIKVMTKEDKPKRHFKKVVMQKIHNKLNESLELI